MVPSKPEWLQLDESQPIQEHNGFTLLDVEPNKMTVRLFTWHEPQAVEEIDTLEPRTVGLIDGTARG